MSDRMRWRYGDTNPVVAPVAADTVIEIGDLVYYDNDPRYPGDKTCFPARDLPPKPAPEATETVGWVDPVRYTQARFAARFLGVAMQRSRAGDTSPIRVATTGVFEFECPAPDRFELGDCVGVWVQLEDDEVLRCQSQLVGAVPTGRDAVARVARVRVRGDKSVLVDIRSAVMTGGVLEYEGSQP